MSNIDHANMQLKFYRVTGTNMPVVANRFKGMVGRLVEIKDSNVQFHTLSFGKQTDKTKVGERGIGGFTPNEVELCQPHEVAFLVYVEEHVTRIQPGLEKTFAYYIEENEPVDGSLWMLSYREYEQMYSRFTKWRAQVFRKHFISE